jgi:hypothetical protein
MTCLTVRGANEKSVYDGADRNFLIGCGGFIAFTAAGVGASNLWPPKV